MKYGQGLDLTFQKIGIKTQLGSKHKNEILKYEKVDYFKAHSDVVHVNPDYIASF